MGLLCLSPLSTIVQLYRGCQLIGGGGRSIWRNPPTSRKWLTSKSISLKGQWVDCTPLRKSLYCLIRHVYIIVQLYRGCQLIGGGGRSIWRNPPTSRKWLTSFILIQICICMYNAQYGPSKYYLLNRNYVYMSNETV
jgi:hypothetical protein